MTLFPMDDVLLEVRNRRKDVVLGVSLLELVTSEP
jgi:hypothetical protein